MITIPSLDPCTDIQDTDLLLVTQSNGDSYKMTGAEFNKRNQVIISANTTLTGTPLKSGNVVRVLFTADQSAANSSTTMAISYNTTNYTVKVCKMGALANYLPFEVSTDVYKYCQAYTALELLYDGTNFIIMGNPVVLSNANTNTYADGKIISNSSLYFPRDKVFYYRNVQLTFEQSYVVFTHNLNTTYLISSIQNKYKSGAILNPVFTVQYSSASAMIIYGRDGNGNLIPDGTVLNVDIILFKE